MTSEATSIGPIRVGAVIGGALKLVVRRSFSVLAWGLFTTLAGVWPLSVILLSLIPRIDAAAQSAAMAGQAGASTALLIQLAASGVLAGLVAVVVLGVADAAVYRAVLEPDNRGFFYLKLRRRELELTGLYLLHALIWAALAAVAILPVAWIVGFVANTFGRSPAVLFSLIAALAAGFLMAVVALRLSLAGPMTFAGGGTGMRGSWRATRDRFGGVLAVAILVALLLWLWTLLFWAFGHMTLFAAVTELASGPSFERRMAILGLLSLYLGVARVVVMAPGALLLRQLAQAVAVVAAPAPNARPLTLS